MSRQGPLQRINIIIGWDVEMIVCKVEFSVFDGRSAVTVPTQCKPADYLICADWLLESSSADCWKFDRCQQSKEPVDQVDWQHEQQALGILQCNPMQNLEQYSVAVDDALLDVQTVQADQCIYNVVQVWRWRCILHRLEVANKVCRKADQAVALRLDIIRVTTNDWNMAIDIDTDLT